MDGTTPGSSIDGASFDSGISEFEQKDVQYNEDDQCDEKKQTDYLHNMDVLNRAEEHVLEAWNWTDPFGCERRQRQAMLEREERSSIHSWRSLLDIKDRTSLDDKYRRGRKRARV